MRAVMRLNMLPFVSRLNDEDWKVIAFAMCRKGYLTKYPHFRRYQRTLRTMVQRP